MLVGDNYHLTYCTNVHPMGNWEQTLAILKAHLPKVKKAVSPKKPFGVGLHLSNLAYTQMVEGNKDEELIHWLKSEGLYVFTMNGFPFGGFHKTKVKDNVYKPDWTKEKRAEYTLGLLNALGNLLPKNVQGSVSTLPISYKYWDKLSKKKMEAACKHLTECAYFAHTEVRDEYEREVYLAIEPEPDCVLENSDEMIHFFEEQLLPFAVKYLAKEYGCSEKESEQVIRERIRVCYDVCHFSVEYEEPLDAVRKFVAHGIGIGKIQISAALKAKFPAEKAERKKIIEQFKKLSEPRYMHQTITKSETGELTQYRDLPAAIKDAKNTDTEWRTHFHVPLFVKKFGDLQSTQSDVVKVLKYLKNNHVTDHLEVETYTWDVLPSELKTDLDDSIIRELKWVKQNLEA